MTKRDLGLIQVYTGDGKGKTTAALGLALRAAGSGFRTYIGQFLKGRDYGELRAVEMLAPYVTIEQLGGPSFVHPGKATPEDVALARQGLDKVKAALQSGEYDIVVMDEVNVALYFELLTVEELLQVINDKPDNVELVLTGRRVPQEIIDLADLVTEMSEVKHPYQQGIKARKGIEF
jgi:cob(I)alamin adenosyltransferase